MNRILASHFETEQGVNFAVGCENPTTNCKGWFRGRLQPYAIYVPNKSQPPGGYGLTLLLHSLGANYNQFADSANQSQFGERGAGSIVITAEARGPDAWYYDHGGADVFEMWADVAARYQLDPEWTAIAGYSMGGYATYKFTTQFPDLFAKAQPTVGPPGQGIWVPPADPQPGGARSNTFRMLASVRNIPFLIWNGAADELVPVAGAAEQAQEFDALGYRYEWDLFTTADHFALAVNDEYGPAADFLGSTEVDRNPPHVTYVYNPTMDFPDAGTKAGHAYWVSDVTLRNSSGAAPLGTVDVRSEGFGVGDPTPSGTSTGAGALTGGQIPAMPYVSQTQTWGAAPSAPMADRLRITATNVSSITIDARRARVSCNPELIIDSDGPIDVDIEDCGYARPLAATPLHVPLTVAYEPCSSPDRMHAAPLSFGSCGSPEPASDHLTVGTPDSNGRVANAVGSLRYRVVPGDVQLAFSMTDVRNQGDLSDYTGQLEADQSLRITDRANGPSAAETGTLADAAFPVPVPCAATADPAIGSTCAVNTSANSIVPGAVAAGNRAVWQLGQVQVSDGGSDGLAATGPNTNFLRQGLFVP
jgi:predicted esterase